MEWRKFDFIQHFPWNADTITDVIIYGDVEFYENLLASSLSLPLSLESSSANKQLYRRTVKADGKMCNICLPRKSILRNFALAFLLIFSHIKQIGRHKKFTCQSFCWQLINLLPIFSLTNIVYLGTDEFRCFSHRIFVHHFPIRNVRMCIRLPTNSGRRRLVIVPEQYIANGNKPSNGNCFWLIFNVACSLLDECAPKT